MDKTKGTHATVDVFQCRVYY